MNRLFKKIKSFRLGYTDEHPYPWRWTTPIVLCAFLFITPFLAVVNVPLSAYNIVQEVTYQPNDTLPAVFMGNLVPSVLQNPMDSFTPQQLKVGDIIMLDDYIFKYTITEAFDGVDASKTVSSFPYYNNPLSDGCDSANITVGLSLTELPEPGWALDLQVSGTVVCYLPSLFYLAWDGLPTVPTEVTDLRNTPYLMRDDLDGIFLDWSGLGMNATQVDISFTVHACCDCDAVLAGGALESSATLLGSPCASNPMHFIVIDAPLITFSSDTEDEGFQHGPPPMQITDLLDPLANISIASLGTICENQIQALYHLVRLDLGVIVENQIYNSPEMFNRTITDMGEKSSAREARGLTSNATLMAQWEREVEFFQHNERVPPLEYFRPVPRLKPVGSAVTSVFVSTFAMLSVMWTIFSLVAGALARAHKDGANRKGTRLGEDQKEDNCLESGIQEVEESEVILLGDLRETLPDPVAQLRKRMDKHDIEGVQLRAALARMSAALKKHGIAEEESCNDDMSAEGRNGLMATRIERKDTHRGRGSGVYATLE